MTSDISFWGNYSKKQIIAAWNKCDTIEGKDPNVWRLDYAGALIHYECIGAHVMFGWDLVRIKPKRLGGTNDDSNLIIMHWRNARFKRLTGTYPTWRSVVTVNEKKTKNKEEIREWTIEN